MPLGFEKAVLSDSGKVPDKNGLTRAGRALQKHIDGPRGLVWESLMMKITKYPPPTKMEERNRVGQQVLDYIVYHAESRWSTGYSKGLGVKTIVARLTIDTAVDPIGVQWDQQNGSLIGFLD
ncbi:MAG: hypothetical protein ACOYL5_18240 [Phototrophicaceae bacterium]